MVNGEVVKEFEQDWGTTETFKFKLTLSKGDKVEIVDLTPVTYTATTDRGYEMKEYDNNIIIEDKIFTKPKDVFGFIRNVCHDTVIKVI